MKRSIILIAVVLALGACADKGELTHLMLANDKPMPELCYMAPSTDRFAITASYPAGGSAIQGIGVTSIGGRATYAGRTYECTAEGWKKL